MAARSRIKLQRLREIGWAAWDPLNLRRLEKDWETRCIDEYDRYLMIAASRLWNGASESDVAAYLVQVETAEMGLTPGDGEAAAATAKALKAHVEGLKR